MDGNKLDYTITSTDDSWLLHFTYSHSTHSVTISLGASGWFGGDLENWIIYTVIAIIVGIIVVAAVLALRKKKAKNM